MPGSTEVVTLPFDIVMRFADLLGSILKMEPGYQVYDTAVELTKDLKKELVLQLAEIKG